MSSKGNFTQALKELTGFDEQPDRTKRESRAEERNRDAGFRFETKTTVIDDFEPKVGNAESDRITSSMIIHGKIKSENDIVVEGRIYGDVTTSANLISTSLISGDIDAQNISLKGAKIKGNMKAYEKINVGEGSIVVGDIKAEDISVDGKIKGNISAQGLTILKEQALVSGDIETGNILSSVGATLKGIVKTSRSTEIDEDEEFDLGE